MPVSQIKNSLLHVPYLAGRGLWSVTRDVGISSKYIGSCFTTKSLKETSNKVSTFVKEIIPDSVRKQLFWIAAISHSVLLGHVHSEKWTMVTLSLYTVGFAIYKSLNAAKVAYAQTQKYYHVINAYWVTISVIGLLFARSIIPLIETNRFVSKTLQYVCLAYITNTLGKYIWQKAEPFRNKVTQWSADFRVSAVWMHFKKYAGYYSSMMASAIALACFGKREAIGILVGGNLGTYVISNIEQLNLFFSNRTNVTQRLRQIIPTISSVFKGVFGFLKWLFVHKTSACFFAVFLASSYPFGMKNGLRITAVPASIYASYKVYHVGKDVCQRIACVYTSISSFFFGGRRDSVEDN